MTLAGRNAIVTGSAAGLGRAIAERLAAGGAGVLVHGLDPAQTDEVAERLRAGGAAVASSSADLGSAEGVAQLVTEAERALGTVDIVVNNAVVRHSAPLEEWSPADWDASLAVNLSAAFHLARLAIPGMRERGWGRILMMSSVYGSRGETDRVGYVTTKTALLGLMRAIAIETAGTGITANAIAPGTVPTEAIVAKIAREAEAAGRPEEDVAREYVAARHPTGRFVPTDDVAELAAYLCGPHSAAITGSVLPIDGGWGAR